MTTEEEGTGSMTLWVLCEHGEKGSHRTPGDPPIDPGIRCPGGCEASIEDLIEALGGEKVWACLAHPSAVWGVDAQPAICDFGAMRKALSLYIGDCQLVERILTPALDQEKVGESG